MREVIEFGCNDCSGHFRVNLNLGVEGSYLFVCPKCGREHPRAVVKGEVVDPVTKRIYKDGTGKRISRNHQEKTGERILVPMSAYSTEPLLEKLEQKSGGFLANLWARTTSHKAK